MYTKGPWRLAGGMVDGYAIIGSDNSVVCETGRISNANNRHIVSCVNSHDELLESLEGLKEVSSDVARDLTDLQSGWYYDFLLSIERARTAIAKARGE